MFFMPLKFLSLFSFTVAFNVLSLSLQVPPSPPYPVVLGCNNPLYCLLEIETSGYLTCSLQRVRPLINLEWRALPGKKEHITFSDETQKVTSQGETFDVTLTIWYQLTKPSHDIVPVECISTGEHEELNTLVARVDLMPRFGTSCSQILSLILSNCNTTVGGRKCSLLREADTLCGNFVMVVH